MRVNQKHQKSTVKGIKSGVSTEDLRGYLMGQKLTQSQANNIIRNNRKKLGIHKPVGNKPNVDNVVVNVFWANKQAWYNMK